MNKSAKEMFEELGYEYIEFDDNFCYRSKHHNLEGSWLEISFQTNIKEIDTYMCDMCTLTKFRCNLDLDLIKAIKKQIEEPGWNNE